MPPQSDMGSAASGLGLADSGVLALRAAQIDARHVCPLNAYARDLAARHGDVPFFDPADGGIDARLLVMLETPAPSAAAIRFVSRDNPTGTARNLRRLFEETGLSRNDSVIWNAIPWTLEKRNGRLRAPTTREADAARPEVARLLALLPRLECAVLMGRFAGRLQANVLAARHDLQVFATPHPSPTFVCTSPAIRPAMTAVFGRIAIALRQARSNDQQGVDYNL